MIPKYKTIQFAEMDEHGNFIYAEAVDLSEYKGIRPYYDLIYTEPEKPIATFKTEFVHDKGSVSCEVEIVFRKAPCLMNIIRSTFLKNVLHKSNAIGFLLINTVQITERHCTFLSGDCVERIDWKYTSDLNIIGDEHSSLERVKLHLFNFPYFESEDVTYVWKQNRCIAVCRLSFTLGEFVYTISSLPETGSQHDRLNEYGGHVLTHVLEFRRVDGQCFSIETAKVGMRYFEMLLSFVTGKSVSMMLPVGFSSEDMLVWQQITRPQFIREVFLNWSFFDCKHIGIQSQLTNIAKRFDEVIRSNKLNEFSRILEWYIAVQTANSYSVLITACVACLEKIVAFQDFASGERIKCQHVVQFLSSFKIDISLVDSLRTYKNREFANFAELVFAYRSDFAHAKQEYDFTEHVTQSITARLMTITDLAMLAMLRYTGDYRDRHNSSVWSEPLMVPWAGDKNV